MKDAAIRQDLLEAAVERLPQDGLSALRKSALERFAGSGFPGPAQEDWRYTNLAPAIELSNAWLVERAGGRAANDAAAPLAHPSMDAIDAHWLRIHDGLPLAEDFARLVDAGLDVTTLSAGGAVPVATDDALTNFNSALLEDGIRIRVPQGAVVDKPIGLLLTGNAAVSQARVVLELGANASMQLIENHVAVADANYTNVVVEARLGRASALDVLRLQQLGERQLLTGRFAADLAADAMLRHVGLDLGGALVRNDVAVNIGAPGASAALDGLYLASGKQHIDNHLRVDHRVGPATSRVAYKGILNDRARCVWNGKAIVHDGADGTDAEQSNHNLLLSEQAEIDTKPELEIYADDVKCAHGATVGQLDRTALFYLRSRGISREDAAAMLTRAFAAEVLGRLSIAAAAGYVAELLNRRLETLARAGA
ncbi:MAG: Fe-S cluster assembly protein SufD [Woeseiaceae bacterium]